MGFDDDGSEVRDKGFITMNNKSMLQSKIFHDTLFFAGFFDNADKPADVLQATQKAQLDKFPDYPEACRANVQVKGKDYTFFYIQDDRMMWNLTNVILPEAFAKPKK